MGVFLVTGNTKTLRRIKLVKVTLQKVRQGLYDRKFTLKKIQNVKVFCNMLVNDVIRTKN